MTTEQMIPREVLLPTVIFLQQISNKERYTFLEENAKTIDCFRAAFVSTGTLHLHFSQIKHSYNKSRPSVERDQRKIF